MVNSSKKCNDEWGIKGYNYIDYNPHLDKPTVFSIAKEPPGKPPRDYISMLQKQKKNIPGPIYEIGGDIAKGGKFSIPKGKTPTYFASVINEAKKFPGVGKYNIDQQKPKVLGNYLLKDTGGGFSDEAVFKGMSTPSHHNVIDMAITKNRTISYKIQKPKDAKPDNKVVKDNSPSPFHYRKEDSIDKTQRTNISYGIPKGAKTSFTDTEIKKTKIVPGIGKYDITKADRVMTLGARKGYK